MPENNKPQIKKMLRPGQYIDEQLPEVWSEKDLAKLTRDSTPGKGEESRATESQDESESNDQ